MSALAVTVTISNSSVPVLRSKQVLGVGSHSAASTVPETENVPQSPPFKTISHSSPSFNSVMVIVPSVTEAGLSPPTVPPLVVVTEMILASEPV